MYMLRECKILFLFLTCFLNAQQNPRAFLVEVLDNNYIPIMNNTTKRYFVDEKLKHSEEINMLFSELDVDNSVYVNDIDIHEPKNLIFISVLQTDSKIVSSTLNKLINDYSYYASYEEVETHETLAPQTYIPIDYENAFSFMVNDPNQYDLRMIRATEAWQITTGDPDVLIGIADTGFWAGDPNIVGDGHPDLDSEIVGGIGPYDTGPNTSSNPSASKHGSAVAGRASAATDNEVRSISSIGFNTKMIVAKGTSVYNLKLLSDMGAKVVNASFGGVTASIPTSAPPSGQNDYSRIQNMVNNGTVVVAAAGNGPFSGGASQINGVYSNENYASRYYIPASYKNVISVSTVGDKNDIGSTTQDYDSWKDVHLLHSSHAGNNQNYSGSLVPFNEDEFSWQHNDSVDIVVPAYNGSPRIFPNNNLPHQPVDFYRTVIAGGTSYSAPIVAGTVGLMFSVNFCLDPKEVETILKLTAVKIDTIPENLPFYGRLGAGRLDAYEAVKMSKDMAEIFGTVDVRDRILYRPWFYKLATAPYEIKMTNNDVSQGSKLKFRARNNIEILSGDYFPGTGGYIDLQIDSNLPLNDCPPPVSQAQSKQAQENPEIEREFDLKIYPTLVIGDLNIEQYSKENHINNITVKIYDFYGVEVFIEENLHRQKSVINLSDLKQGIYIVKVLNSLGEVIQTDKIIKK